MSNAISKRSNYFKYVLLGVISFVIIVFSVFAQRDIPKNILLKKYTTAESKFIPIMGMRVHYRDQGNINDSTPLLLIHGTSSSLHTWNKVNALILQKTKGNKRVVTVDMPAFGLTGPNPDNKYSYENYNQFIDSLLIKLGISKCIIGGNSLGGGIAWHYTVAFPNKVSSLILIDASGYPKKNEKGSLGFKIAQIPVINNLLLYITPKSLVRKSIEGVYYNHKLIEEETVTRYHELLLCEDNRKAALSLFKNKIEQHPELIKTIQVPTLIIWGKEDALIDYKNAYLFNQDIKNSNLVMLEKVGHVPNEEAPEKVANAIIAFLK
jgi:pimeloyl-ACP methyl ester carboxylesterase